MVDTAKNPLATFDPRYRELLVRGSLEEFTIPCHTEAKAHRFQMTLCQFRARLRKHFGDEQRGEWEPLYACVIGKLPGDPTSLRLYPRHSEFDDILGPIEIEAPGLDHDILADLDTGEPNE